MQAGATSTLTAAKLQDRNILRYAFGATFITAVALGFNWPVAFLTPVLALMFLGKPGHCPSFAEGLGFVIALSISSFAGVIFTRLLIPYPLIHIPITALILLQLFFATPKQIPSFLKLFLMIALAAIPFLGLQSMALATVFATTLVVNGSAAIILVWVVYFFFPEKAVPAATVAQTAVNLPEPSPMERFRTAVISLIVVFPVLLLYYYFAWVSSLTILIFIMILAMQPGFAKDFKAGSAMVLANVLGGIVAIIIYELLVVAPMYIFMVLLVLLAGLFFGVQLFSSKPTAALYGSAFSTVLLIVASTTSSSNTDADSKAYTRIVQIMVAVIYVVVASGTVRALFDSFKKKGAKIDI